MRRSLILLSALLAAAAFSVPAAADQQAPWKFESCVADHAACAERCRAGGDEAKDGAGCLVACASAEVECVATRTAKGLTPWIERKSEQFRDFLDDFLRDLPLGPEDRPAPPPSGPDFDQT